MLDSWTVIFYRGSCVRIIALDEAHLSAEYDKVCILLFMLLGSIKEVIIPLAVVTHVVVSDGGYVCISVSVRPHPLYYCNRNTLFDRLYVQRTN